MRRRSPPRRRRQRGAGEEQEEEEDAHPSPDRLSALPDALLHHVMSSLKAWEVVRTCVLARRWRHLWATAPCVDLRLRPGRADGDTAPEDFPRFVRRLFRRRDASAPVDTLRLRSSDVDGAFDEDDARSWIRTAVKRKARVVHLVGHRDGLAALEHTAFVSRHLRILKLSYANLDDNLLRQLSSRCPSLEEMDLKDCLISGSEISSSSLKTLAMVNCNMFWGLTITAPNLVLLRCLKPIGQAPSFNNLGSLVAGTIILDDYCFSGDFEDFSKDELDETTDDDSDDCKKWRRKIGAGYGFGLSQKRNRLGGYKDADDYGSDIESDDNTYEYSEIANDFDGSGCDDVGDSSRKDGNLQAYGETSRCGDSKISGGRNIIHSLSKATSLELLADAGEVQ